MSVQTARVVEAVLEGIHYIYDETELADTVLKTVAKALDAEAGSVFTVREDGTLNPIASFRFPVEKLRRVKIKVGQGIAGWVARHGKPAKVDDAPTDPRFFAAVDKSTGFKTVTVVAAPILSRGKSVGVIEFLNRKGGPFEAEHLELISKVGREIGIAFENVRLVRRLGEAVAFQDALLRSLSAGIIILDSRGSVLRVNPAAERILAVDFPATDDEPKSPHKLFELLDPLIAVLEKLTASEDLVSRQETRLTVRGQFTIIGYSGMPIFSKDGRRLGSALLFQDITQFSSNR